MKKIAGLIGANIAYFQGLRTYREKNWNAAERVFRRAVEKHPQHAAAHFKLGMCRFRQKDWQGALTWMERAISIQSNQQKWKMQRDQARRHLGLSAPASSAIEEQALRTRIERGENNGKVYHQLAKVLRKQGKWWQEIDALKEAISRDPSNAEWYFRLGEALETTNRFQEAASVFQQALERDPSRADWAYRMGYAYEREGFDGPTNPSLAQKAYARAIEADETGESASFGIGAFHQKRGHWAAAAVAYEKQVSSDPRNPELFYRLGLSYDRCYQWEKAEAAIRRSLALDPSHPYRHARLGFVLERQKRFEEAAAAYGYAAGTDTKDSRDWLYRQGVALTSAGFFEDAVQAFLNMQPEGRRLVPYLPEIWAGQIERLEDTLKEDARPAELHFELGQAYERSQNWHAAAIAYQAAIARQDDHKPNWFFRLGTALSHGGSLEDACAAFRQMRLIGNAYTGSVEEKLPRDQNSRRRTIYTEHYENLSIQDKTILYESFHGGSMSCNPFAIFKHLLEREEFQDWNHIWVINEQSKIPDHLRNRPEVSFVSYQSDGYLRALATAKVLINNSTFPSFFIRREEQKYLNTWHGTPIKFMGRNIRGEFFSHANTARNFLQATHIISPNRHTSDVLLKDYDIVPLFQGTLAETGYPRIDATLNMSMSDREGLRSRLGVKPNDQILLYAPTWRGSWNDASFDTQRLLDDLTILKNSGFHVIFRGHYHVEKILHSLSIEDVVAPADVETNDLLAITDVLVTDYSSVAVDFIARKKPIIYYAYDLLAYESERGFYFPLTDLPGDLCTTQQDLEEVLHRGFAPFDPVPYETAAARYCKFDDGNATRRVVDLVFLDQQREVELIARDNRRSAIFYGGAMMPNGITTSLINLLSHLDQKKVALTVVIDPGSVVGQPDRIEQLRRIPQGINLFGRVGARTFTVEEDWVNGKFAAQHQLSSPDMWNVMRQGYEREFRRMFGPAQTDALINFDGYTRFWLYTFAFAPSSSASRKVLYQHNDMRGEWRAKFPYLEGAFHLYKEFDALIGVSPAIRDLNRTNLSQHFAIPAEKFTFAENVHNPKYVLEAADREIENAVEQHLLDEAHPCFLTMGRLSVEKDQEKLIRAFKGVLDHAPNARLLILGDGPLRQRLIQVIEELGLRKSVFLLGRRSNPFPYLKRSNCFVLPSNHEGQPMVLFEALILGKPIIATDIPGNRGALEGRPARLVKNSVEGLEAGMLAFLNDPASPISFKIDDYQQNALAAFKREVLGDKSAVEMNDASAKRRSVIAIRNDGLGERLNAIVNGIYLSTIIRGDFRFNWSHRFLTDPGHAIEPIEEIFHPDFIKQYLLKGSPPSKRWELAGKDVTLSDLESKFADIDAIASPRLDLADILDSKVMDSFTFSRKDAFSQIKFSDKITRAVDKARAIDISPNSVGLHLRSGDIFYGIYRKQVHYTYKGITLPIVKAIIEHINESGRKVYLFGQDKEVIAYLCREYEAIDIASLFVADLESFGSAERAMFDLVTMSRFSEIIAGSSGFAKQASWIGGGKLLSSSDFFNARQQYAISIADLESNADNYPALQTAFAYWFAYYFGRNQKTFEQQVHLLTKAATYDPTNELYPFVLGALHFRNGAHERAEEILSGFFQEQQDTGRWKSALEVFVAKTLGTYNLGEFHKDIEGNARHGGPYSSFLAWYLLQHRGEAARAAEALKQLKGHSSIGRLAHILDHILGVPVESK